MTRICLEKSASPDVVRAMSLTDPINNKTQWQYDAAGRMTEETDPLGNAKQFFYDNADELTEILDRDKSAAHLQL